MRDFVIIRNEPKFLLKIEIERNIRGDFIINDLTSPELAHLMSQGSTLKIKWKEVPL
ncbi:MAG: hypothetical protein ACTSRI_19720 [Promethearchaeota archaeon]